MTVRLLGDAVLRRRAWTSPGRLGWASTYDAEYVALTQLQADAFSRSPKPTDSSYIRPTDAETRRRACHTADGRGRRSVGARRQARHHLRQSFAI